MFVYNLFKMHYPTQTYTETRKINLSIYTLIYKHRYLLN